MIGADHSLSRAGHLKRWHKRMIGEGREWNPSQAVLAIRLPREEVDFDVGTHTLDMHDHPWLATVTMWQDSERLLQFDRCFPDAIRVPIENGNAERQL
jgi:hypothetical protein